MRDKRSSLLTIGSLWKSQKYGGFIITEYVSCKEVHIKFIETGYETSTRSDRVKSGEVRDYLTPTVYGVGVMGARDAQKNNARAYKIWEAMLRRCYSDVEQHRAPSYKGCTVSDDWLIFTNFLPFYLEHHFEGGELDKDIKIEGNKVYSAETCLFVTKKQNVEKATAKIYDLINPSGSMVTVFNMLRHCKDNNLSRSEMSKLSLGKIDEHRGWRRQC